MFEATLNDSSIFKKIMEALKEIVKEGNFECSENGITFQGVDSSFVALVQLTLRKQGFAEYRIDDNMNLGINIENILKLLKCAGGKDSLTLTAQEDSDLLSLQFTAPERTSKFDLKLMDIDQEALTVPNITYETVCSLPSAEFQRIVRDLGSLGDTLSLRVSKEGITFAVEGTTGSGSITLNAGEGSDAKDTVKIKTEDEYEQKFTVRYLTQFAKAASLSPNVALKLSSEQPLAVEYRMTNPNEDDDSKPTILGVLRFFLAPKSSDEADE
eukprot:UN01655